ncbi:dual specificity protein phosphatase [Plakobranchus ocellatus]|uniref:protein-tyrosine-phosphatase n=1 Tax=Plakobranchus ocellatus TaxID=259542 RepID=A0AAV4AJ54_9GAST|nr:dual specificity protein phosphatase [Plakobranchus ocellatus]
MATLLWQFYLTIAISRPVLLPPYELTNLTPPNDHDHSAFAPHDHTLQSNVAGVVRYKFPYKSSYVIHCEDWFVGSTVASESALKSAGTFLSLVRAPPPAPWPDGGLESLRSPSCGLAIYKTHAHEKSKHRTGRVVDCRSFLNYNTERIIGSVNVFCPPLVKKRFQSCLPLASMLSDETKTTLARPMVETVVLHDQCTNQALFYLGQSDLPLVYQSLKKFLGNRQYMILNGGFCSFHQQFPKYCSRHTSFSGQLLQAKRNDAMIHSTISSPGGSPLDNCLSNTAMPRRKLSLSPVELLPYLYIGDAGHSTRKELLLGFKISAILNVSTSCENHFPTDFRYKVIPVEDSSSANLLEWFQDAILFIERERRAGGKVLVHCHGGISRSATVCLAYLMFSRHLRLDDAFDYVRARRHVISPNANFMMQLSQFETELRKLGFCWPSTWQERYPSSSSSTTTDEDMSWEDEKTRLESSSSTTSSEFSWHGSSRGSGDIVLGLHCVDPGLSPAVVQDQPYIKTAARKEIGASFPGKQTATNSSVQSKKDTGRLENLNAEMLMNPRPLSSEEVFDQTTSTSSDIKFAVHDCQQLSPKLVPDPVVPPNLIDTETSINFPSLTPPPKSPSLNFACLHQQPKSNSQNFFFGSCPDISGANISKAARASSPNQWSKGGNLDGDDEEVFANGTKENIEESRKHENDLRVTIVSENNY